MTMPRYLTVLFLLLSVFPTSEGFPQGDPARSSEPSSPHVPTQDGEEIPPLVFLSDPLEPLNRSFGYVNHAFMIGLVDPTSRVYRTIVPTPVRKSVGKAGENLAYPIRLVNNLLQAQWSGAGVETERFVVNTTAGGLGFFDPATKWGIGSSEEDTGKTFRTWGWSPHFYLMLPFFGPSSDPDGFGKIGDMGLNPATYLFPAGSIFTYNGLADDVLRYKQFTSTEYDPYALSRDIWAVARQVPNRYESETPDPSDSGALQALGAVRTHVSDPKFLGRKKKRRAAIPETGGNLPYSLWLQKKASPVVYILPGLGGHREGILTLAMAERVYQSGFSVVTIGSAFNWEFIQEGSTAPVPGYQPTDCRDLVRALEIIHRDLERRYPERIGGRSLLGISMGAFHTLSIAAGAEELEPQGIVFDRYVAIHPPVNLLFGLRQLDSFYNAPLLWSEEEREARMNLALEKSAALLQQEEHLPAVAPLSNTEAQFLIGLLYRFGLRDVIHASQRKNNLGAIRSSLGSMRREQAYAEIMAYSFEEYYETFVLPSATNPGGGKAGRSEIERTGNLRTWETSLSQNRKVRVLTSRNDFLLSDKDLDWLSQTFTEDRLTLNERGGHLGTLGEEKTLSQVVNLLR